MILFWIPDFPSHPQYSYLENILPLVCPAEMQLICTSSPGSHRQPAAKPVPRWEELREEPHQPENADSATKVRLRCVSDFSLTLLVPHLSKREKKWEMFSEFLGEIQDGRAYIRSPTNKIAKGRWYHDFFQFVNLITINSYQVISLKVRSLLELKTKCFSTALLALRRDISFIRSAMHSIFKCSLKRLKEHCLSLVYPH